MSQDFYPSASQLDQRLFSAGVIPRPISKDADQIDLESACEAAAQAWEEMTGFLPFLAEATDSTHYFDPDGSTVVDLQGGFVSITSVSVNANGQTLNTGYRTMPMNAGTNGKPITYLKFDRFYGSFLSLYAPLPGQSGPVAVTGKRGAYVLLPQLAYEGILNIAVCSLLGAYEFSKFRGVKSWTIGSDERAYDLQAFTRLDASCQATVARALNKFRRIKVA